METKKGLDIFFVIIALITGSKLYKHTDFQNFKFEKPAIDTIYLIVFVASVIFIIKDLVTRPESKSPQQ